MDLCFLPSSLCELVRGLRNKTWDFSHCGENVTSIFIHHGAVDYFFRRWFRGAGYRWINSIGLRVLMMQDQFCSLCSVLDDARFRSWTSVLALNCNFLHYDPPVSRMVCEKSGPVCV